MAACPAAGRGRSLLVVGLATVLVGSLAPAAVAEPPDPAEVLSSLLSPLPVAAGLLPRVPRVGQPDLGGLYEDLAVGSAAERAALTEAFASKRPVEVLSARTERAVQLALPDGSLRWRVASDPVRFRDAAGRWTEIDTTLVDALLGGRSTRASKYRVTLPRAASGAVRVQTPWGAFGVSHSGALCDRGGRAGVGADCAAGGSGAGGVGVRAGAGWCGFDGAGSCRWFRQHCDAAGAGCCPGVGAL